MLNFEISVLFPKNYSDFKRGLLVYVTYCYGGVSFFTTVHGVQKIPDSKSFPYVEKSKLNVGNIMVPVSPTVSSNASIVSFGELISPWNDLKELWINTVSPGLNPNFLKLIIISSF